MQVVPHFDVSGSRTIAAVVLAGCLSACATSNQPETWMLNGRSQQQFAMDRARCQQLAADQINDQNTQSAGQAMARGGSSAALGGLLAALEMAQSQGAFARCMEARGYVRRP